MQIAKLLTEVINLVQMLVINEMQGFSNNYKNNDNDFILGWKRIRLA